MKHSFVRFSTATALIALLSGCNSIKTPEGATIGAPATANEQRREKIGSLTGDKNGFAIFGGKKREGQTGEGAGGIGVNAYLWKAALNTISFMPINSADPFGGVIVTDWYTAPETPNERLKLNVFILDQALRADAVKVSTFKQIRNKNGWQDAIVSPQTNRDIEDAILVKARQLKIEATQGN